MDSVLASSAVDRRSNPDLVQLKTIKKIKKCNVGNPGHGWTHAQNVALISVFHNNWVNLALTVRETTL
jgi:hypothetical protein